MIRLVTDSIVGIPQELADDLGIEVVSLYINGPEGSQREMDMDIDAFYQDIDGMADNPPKSSQPSQADFMELFEEAAVAGDEVLGVFCSVGFSGTIDGAIRAARSVKASHLDFKAAFVDARSVGYDQAWTVMDAAAAIQAGLSLEECVKVVADAVPRSKFLFITESLTFLYKGGRIGTAAGLMGNALKLTPLFTVRDGVAHVLQKVRTFKKATQLMFDTFVQDAQACGLRGATVHYIGNSRTKSKAEELARNLVEPFVGHKVQVLPVSPVLGLHVGPAIGISFCTKDPMEGKITVPLEPAVYV